MFVKFVWLFDFIHFCMFQVPAEYLNLLQQLQAQQGHAQQVNPSDIQQLLISR